MLPPYHPSGACRRGEACGRVSAGEGPPAPRRCGGLDRESMGFAAGAQVWCRGCEHRSWQTTPGRPVSGTAWQGQQWEGCKAALALPSLAGPHRQALGAGHAQRQAQQFSHALCGLWAGGDACRWQRPSLLHVVPGTALLATLRCETCAPSCRRRAAGLVVVCRERAAAHGAPAGGAAGTRGEAPPLCCGTRQPHSTRLPSVARPQGGGDG